MANSTEELRMRMRQRSAAPPASGHPAASAGVPSDFNKEILFSKTGQAMQRPMTEQEKTQIQHGILPMQKLTEQEKRSLVKMGWTEGQPVPPDIADKFAKFVNDYKQSEQYKNLPSEMPILDIDDLPPSEQERVKEMFLEASETLNNKNTKPSALFSAYPESAVQAMQEDKIQEVEIPGWDSTAFERERNGQPHPSSEPDRTGNVSTTAAVPEIKTETVSQEQSEKRCVHCGGNPFADLSKTEITDDDKKRFLLAIGSGKSFEKEYSLFNGTITVRFRSLRPGEYDFLNAWACEKAAEETKRSRVDFETFIGIVRRYESSAAAALQTTYLKSRLAGSELFWSAPDGNKPWLKDWETLGITTFDMLLESFFEIAGTESVIAGVKDRLASFNALDYRLTTHVNDENFWAGI